MRKRQGRAVKEPPGNAPLTDPNAEARRIVDDARERSVTLRLIGALAVRQHCQILAFCEPDYSDLDTVGLSGQRREIEKTFEALGYAPNESFNAPHGERCLQFIDPANDRHVDVFLDTLEMDHRIDLRHRLTVDDYTISLSDLLLSKLQIVRLTEKDIRDIITLLKDRATGHEDAPQVINIDYIIDLYVCNWGRWKTLTTNIPKVMEHIGDYTLTRDETMRTQERLATLQETLQTSPKCLRWRLRATLGEGARWYEVPEE